MNSRTYHVGPSTITLVFDNILRSGAQVLVSSDDYMLSMGGGVSAALRIAGGSRVVAEAQKAVPSEAGRVVVTSAGDLGARFVFHAVTIGPRKLDLAPAAIVRQAVQRSITLLPLLGCRSIAFPALGTGVAGIPFDVAAAEMAGTLVSALVECPESLEVSLYLGKATPGSETFFDQFERYAAEKLGLLAQQAASGTRLDGPSDGRRRQAYAMLRHLDARRDALETALLPALAADAAASGEDAASLRKQLAEVRELRDGYEAELAGPAADAAAKAASVFLSSTSMDLQPHRKAARKVIEGLGLRFIGMEDFEASAQAPATLIRRKVEESDHYVGIVGMRYGYRDPSTGLSMTELEYRQAMASGKAVLLFVMDKDAPITAGMVETDPEGFGKLLDFRSRVMKEHTCGLFTGPQDLTAKIERSLQELRR